MVLLLLLSGLFAEASQESNITKRLYEPLIERYILDELRDIRKYHYKLRSDVEQKISRAEVEQTDRSARYITDTVGNIFYIIAAATSLLIFAGWNSLRDIRKKTQDIVEERVEKITQRYNEKLNFLEEALTEQSQKILDNQNKIYKTQYIHSMWMRSHLETNPQSRIEIYDEILKISSSDAEVYAYKADAVLDLDEYEWALSLSNKAIEIDPEYGYAYWQRSCAYAMLGNTNEALADLQMALIKSPNLKDEISKEFSFEKLKESSTFQEMIQKLKIEY